MSVRAGLLRAVFPRIRLASAMIPLSLLSVAAQPETVQPGATRMPASPLSETEQPETAQPSDASMPSPVQRRTVQ